MQQQKMILQKQRDFSEKISATFEFLRKNFKPLFGSLLFIGGPLMIILSIIVAYISLQANDLTLGQTNSTDMISQLVSIYSLLSVTLLASWLIYNLITVITLTYIKLYRDSPENTVITTDMVWKKCIKYIVPILISSIAVGFMIGLGFIFLFIPGIILAIYLSMVNSSIILDDLPFGEAFSKSFDLVGGNFWNTFGLLIVVGIITWILSTAFSIPNAILTGFYAFNSLESGELNSMDPRSGIGIAVLVTGVIANLGSYFINVIPLVATSFQYFNIKEEKESTGLIDQISQMGSTVQDEDETY